MAQMLSSLACLFEKATHSEGRHLAEIDELTDLHRAALSVLISEVEASLPPLQDVVSGGLAASESAHLSQKDSALAGGAAGGSDAGPSSAAQLDCLKTTSSRPGQQEHAADTDGKRRSVKGSASPANKRTKGLQSTAANSELGSLAAAPAQQDGQMQEPHATGNSSPSTELAKHQIQSPAAAPTKSPSKPKGRRAGKAARSTPAAAPVTTRRTQAAKAQPQSNSQDDAVADTRMDVDTAAGEQAHAELPGCTSGTQIQAEQGTKPLMEQLGVMTVQPEAVETEGELAIMQLQHVQLQQEGAQPEEQLPVQLTPAVAAEAELEQPAASETDLEPAQSEQLAALVAGPEPDQSGQPAVSAANPEPEQLKEQEQPKEPAARALRTQAAASRRKALESKKGPGKRAGQAPVCGKKGGAAAVRAARAAAAEAAEAEEEKAEAGEAGGIPHDVSHPLQCVADVGPQQTAAAAEDNAVPHLEDGPHAAAEQASMDPLPAATAIAAAAVPPAEDLRTDEPATAAVVSTKARRTPPQQRSAGNIMAVALLESAVPSQQHTMQPKELPEQGAAEPTQPTSVNAGNIRTESPPMANATTFVLSCSPLPETPCADSNSETEPAQRATPALATAAAPDPGCAAREAVPMAAPSPRGTQRKPTALPPPASPAAAAAPPQAVPSVRRSTRSPAPQHALGSAPRQARGGSPADAAASPLTCSLMLPSPLGPLCMLSAKFGFAAEKQQAQDIVRSRGVDVDAPCVEMGGTGMLPAADLARTGLQHAAGNASVQTAVLNAALPAKLEPPAAAIAAMCATSPTAATSAAGSTPLAAATAAVHTAPSPRRSIRKAPQLKPAAVVTEPSGDASDMDGVVASNALGGAWPSAATPRSPKAAGHHVSDFAFPCVVTLPVDGAQNEGAAAGTPDMPAHNGAHGPAECGASAADVHAFGSPCVVAAAAAGPSGSAEGGSKEPLASAAPSAADDADVHGVDAQPTAAAVPVPRPTGSNLVGVVRSFLPAKRGPTSPAQPAAGKKKAPVRALEVAQAVRKAEEAKSRAKEEARQASKATALQHKGEGAANGGLKAAASSHKDKDAQLVADAAAVGLLSPTGTVKAKAAAFQQRILQDAEARKAEEERRQAAARLVKPAGASGNVVGVAEAARQPRVGALPANLRATPFGAPSAVQQAARPDINEKHKRAEQRRKDEEERRKAELEARQKLKDQRIKSAQQTLKDQRGQQAHQVQVQAASANAAPSARPTPLKQRDVNVPASTAGAHGKDGNAPAAAKSAAAGGALLTPVAFGGGLPTFGGGALARAATQQPQPMTPAELAAEARNVQLLVSSPYVNPGVRRTPRPETARKPTNQVLSYEISPYRSNSDDDDDDWLPDPNKVVPEWTKPSALLQALQAQARVDPETLFCTKMKTCPLEQIFEGMPPLPVPADPVKARKRRDWRGRRGSSGNWIKDRLTWQEETEYKKAMGFC